MARPTTLPGIWGLLTEPLGVSGLAEALGTNPRTLHNWATGKSPIPAIEAGLAAHLCAAHGIAPILYTHPNLPRAWVASSTEGWVMWPWGSGNWQRRRRYMGHLEGLVSADKSDVLSARLHGWPW